MSIISTSEALFERSKKVSPGGVHSPVRAFRSVGGTPIFFQAARGGELFSVEGQRYIDFCQSFGPMLLGHRHPEVQAIVTETLEQAWSLGTCEPYSLELAEWLTQRVPFLEKLRFVTSGTEAVMSALRLARAATGRKKVLKFDGCYHGHVDSLLVKAGSGVAEGQVMSAGQVSSDSAGVPAEIAQLTVLASLDNETEFQEVFKAHQKDLAAVIIEPLPANYGLLLQRQEFLEFVAKTCQEAGVLLIFDEVISGFRVGLTGMAGELGIKPDLVTYGKIIGGGFPVGCYGGRADLMDMVAPAGPVYQAGTLSASPIGMRAGLKTLQIAEREQVWNQLSSRTSTFVTGLKKILGPLGFDVAAKASLFWIHQANGGQPIRNLAQIPNENVTRFKKLFHQCLNNGVYLAPSGFEVGFIGAGHSDALLAEALQLIQSGITK